MRDKRTALVLGATGGIGGETTAALLRHGWSVIAMTRNPAKDLLPPRLDPEGRVKWVAGDAMNAEDVLRAAAGIQAIIHAVNPPGYRGWGKLVAPMIDNSIAAATAVGARLVVPGGIYNFGPDAFPDLKKDSPQHPPTRKGEIRAAVERRIEAAAQKGMPALIVRYGDFFGAFPTSSWFSQGLVVPGKRLDSIKYPGRKGAGHTWAYLPDAAETIARLLDRSDKLEQFARFHFAGVWDADGSAMTRAIAEGVGRPDLKVKGFPWPLLGIAGWFQETPREIYKMRYLWRSSIRLDNRKLVAFLGEEPHTPISKAARDTLKALQVT